tara:strand:- start:1081 stop:1434 length:354 start_codon:yes stop_codon:yes gene_type:complete
MEILYLPIAFACILYLWHNTEVFVEYVSLFGLGKLFYIKDYKEEQEVNPLMDYETFLLTNHNNFLVRLITCPICLSVWFNIFACLVHKNFEAFFLLLWLTWLFYFSIKVIINKSNGD